MREKIQRYYPPWLDLLTFSLMFGMFMYVFIFYSRLPTEIPIHFNMTGEADGWGHKGTIFGLMLIHFHAVVLCFVLNYFLIIRSDDTVDSLYLINIPFIKKDELHTKQIRFVKVNAARMLATTNLTISLLFAVMYYSMVQTGLGNQVGLGVVFNLSLMLVFVPAIYYTWKIYKEVKMER